MNKTQLKALAFSLALRVETGVNTNNAWGFGGANKTIYHLSNGYTVHIGTAYFRHLPPQSFANIRNEHGSIMEPEGVKVVGELLSRWLADGTITKPDVACS